MKTFIMRCVPLEHGAKIRRFPHPHNLFYSKIGFLRVLLMQINHRPDALTAYTAYTTEGAKGGFSLFYLA